jgi:phosphoglycolate phosphatase
VNFILWDVDGTLVRNGPDAGNLYHDAVELAAGRKIDNRLPHTHGKTDGQIVTETLAAHRFDPGLHSVVIDHLDDLSRLRHEAGRHRELCPGATTAVAAAAAAGWRNGLLTGNSAARARFKVTGAGFDASAFDWEHSYFGERSPQRSELTLRARREIGDSRIVIIGDTPNDDSAAQSAGMEFIGVATGIFGADVLRATNAIVVVDDLRSGLAAVLDALGSAD